MSQLPVFGQAGQLDVSAQANIYGAGHPSPPGPAGGGAGILPPSVIVTAGEIIIFQVTGEVSYNGGGDFFGPDGSLVGGTQMGGGYAGISGITHSSRSMFLIGVFVNDQDPSCCTAPPALDFSNDSFANLAPSTNQTFFIGDGLIGTGTGDPQRFLVPTGATRLFLGFADAPNFSGVPGTYDDDVGSLHVVYTRSIPPAPEILRQPQDVEVKSGGTATFLVQASGKGMVRYQWRFNGARISGSTSTSLILENITAFDEGDYTVEVTDDTGTVLSKSARLTLFRDSDGDGLSDSFENGTGRYEIVYGKFSWHDAKADAEQRGGHLATITSQSEMDLLTNAFGNELLSKWLGGTDELAKGQWKWVTGEPWSFTRWYLGQPDNSGGQQHYLWFNTVFGLAWDDINEGQQLGYVLERGFYTNPNNPDTDGDGFTDGDEYEGGSIPTDPNSKPLPRITAQPQRTNVIDGSSVTLAVSANGFGSLAYQWRFNGSPITGATDATLSVSNAKHASAGKYDVVLQNGGGTTTSATAIVKVTPVLEVERLDNGFVIIQLIDSRALGWTVDASADMKTWQRLGAMTYTDGIGVFLDAAVSGTPQRFYRVSAP